VNLCEIKGLRLVYFGSHHRCEFIEKPAILFDDGTLVSLLMALGVDYGGGGIVWSRKYSP